MIPSLLFKIANTVALLSWVLLLASPRGNLTRRLVRNGLVPLALSALYCVALGLSFVLPGGEGGGFNSLEQVRALFQSDWALLAGWVHYLAFDLLTGARVSDELLESGRGSLVVRGPLLFLIFMFGPVGWLVSRIFVKKGLNR